MFRFSIAVHCSPEGKVTTLAVSEDADKIVSARKECTLPGEVGVLLNVRPEKLKKNRAEAVESPPKTVAKKVAKGSK